jgi:patatin-like phospholipase/acyl hydrolase
MLDFYRQRGPVIFPLTRLGGRLKHNARHIFTPKFAQATLLKELEAAYYSDGVKKYLKDSKCRLIIPAYHAIAGSSHVFRTPHHPDLTSDADIEAAHAALATAAAPTFFAAAKIATMVSDSHYFDGGVWANSPAMAAVIEATTFLRVPLERIEVLSLGTTEEPFTVRKQIRAGAFSWLRKQRILSLLMNAQLESSLKLTKRLVGEPRFLRVNTMTSNGLYKLDSPNEIDELIELGSREALEAETLSQVRSRFLNGITAMQWEIF